MEGPPTSSAAAGSSAMRLAFSQSLGLLLDVYRELNSKRLFWISMVLSGVVVAAFAAVGYNEKGYSILWWHFEDHFLSTLFLPKADLYKALFLNLGVGWWLTFLAIILALVTTSTLFPDFLAGGAVDLYLARPIGRARLFLTKYVAGLIFVGMQVTIFCAMSFLVMGVRGGAWVPSVFLAVPVVVLMFSYLWSICALLGTLTRSTIASLLLTILIWGMIFGVQAGESTLLAFSVGTGVQARELRKDIQRDQAALDALEKNPASTRPGEFAYSRRRALELSLEHSKSELADVHDSFAPFHAMTYALNWPLPKTTATTALASRWLDRKITGHPERDPDDEDEASDSKSMFSNPRIARLAAHETGQILRARSATWIIGTSLAFEVAMLSLALWIFCKRDY